MGGRRTTRLLFGVLLAFLHPRLAPPHPAADPGMETLTWAPPGTSDAGTRWGCSTEGEFSQGGG